MKARHAASFGEGRAGVSRWSCLAGSLLLVAVLAASGVAQRPTPSDGVLKNFVRTAAPVIALTNVRVIDGTGGPAREGQTIVIRDGTIAAVGATTAVAPPAGAEVIDLAGRSVMPGIVMLHEHLYYPTGPGVYGQLGESFSRLYLAGGVTTMRTGGNMNGFMDMSLKRAIESGQKAGPAIDATAPYVNGPNQFQQMTAVSSVDDARRHVAYWAAQGATSLKAYMQISRAALGAAIEEGHKRGMKVTGHLCSVTYSEAADLGIDNLEHGFLAATDFVADKQPDTCPGQGRGQQTIAALEENSDAFKSLVRKLIDKRVALTSTLTVFETFTPGRPMPPGLEVLTPQLKTQFEQFHARGAQNKESIYLKLFPKAMALELAFARAGGLLVAGTDPTGSGGVIPGFSNQRQIELLVEAGFTPAEAIKVATWNGAVYLGREKTIGSIAPGKQADLVVVNGNPLASVADVRKTEIVFRHGIAYDPARLIASVSGRVGLF
jgi:enamidase